MPDCMTFPDTVEEFMEQYKVVDTERVYTNGTELVPIYRMKQWFEHLRMTDVPESYPGIISALTEWLNELPTAQPETCEGCKHLGKWENEVEYGFPSPCTCCKRRVEDCYER